MGTLDSVGRVSYGTQKVDRERETAGEEIRAFCLVLLLASLCQLNRQLRYIIARKIFACEVSVHLDRCGVHQGSVDGKEWVCFCSFLSCMYYFGLSGLLRAITPRKWGRIMCHES